MMSPGRVGVVIRRAIDTFSLDFRGLVVLTEAATGYYAVTPVIAAMAGAEMVLAMAAASRYGSAAEAEAATLSMFDQCRVSRDVLRIIREKTRDDIGKADVITNLGHVRPIDARFLSFVKPTAVVSLMWETWEFRPQDVDLNECRRRGVAVLGTNEHHPELQTLRYVGLLAIRLLFDLDIEVLHAKVVVVGGGEFGDSVANSLQANGAVVTRVDPGEESALRSSSAMAALSACDAVVVADHTSGRRLLGSRGEMTLEELKELNPSVSIAHICGGANGDEARELGIPCAPDRFAPTGYMSVATDYLGPRGVVDLHAAGLKVGAELARARLSGLAPRAAEAFVLKTCGVAQGFREEET